jgi:hypothetical protein
MTGNKSGSKLVAIEAGDLISDGRDNWKVQAVDGPAVSDDEIVVERYDGHSELTKHEYIAQCDCGMLVFGDGPCYGCYKIS